MVLANTFNRHDFRVDETFSTKLFNCNGELQILKEVIIDTAFEISTDISRKQS